jgi:glycosyltransferase involved in cell wall biosynthesis
MGLPIRILSYRGVIGNISLFDPIAWLTHLNPRIDRVICNSRAVCQYFLNMKLGGFRLPPQKFTTIYKGHDPAWYETPPADLSQFGIPTGAFTVCCVANYRPNKGTQILLEAARWLPEEENIHFLLVGHLDNRKFLKEMAEYPWREKFHLTGFRNDVQALMAASDILVQPTLWRESFPRSVVEGMSLGVPPVVSSVGGNPELVEDEVSGLVFQQGNPRELAEKIWELKEDPEKRRKMGLQARDRIRTRFNVRITVEKTLKLYRQRASE